MSVTAEQICKATTGCVEITSDKVAVEMPEPDKDGKPVFWQLQRAYLLRFDAGFGAWRLDKKVYVYDCRKEVTVPVGTKIMAMLMRETKKKVPVYVCQYYEWPGKVCRFEPSVDEPAIVESK